MEGSVETTAERARTAANRGAWQEAFDLLAAADARVPLSGGDLPLLATVAYASGHFDQTVDAWERTYGETLRRGDSIAAAGAAVHVALHLLLDTALMAPVRGWAARTERLLEGHNETPVHAWLAVVRSYERMLSGDFAGSLAWARRAIEIGSRLEPAAAAVARVAEARSLILGGEVAGGISLLHEAGVVTGSGELDPLSTGIVYCELICALQGMALYDQADEWTTAMERWCQGNAIGSLHGRCRVHRAEILRLRGALDEAEHHAIAAYDELRPFLHRELGWPLTELGRIRMRKGDLHGAAAAFREADELGWDSQPGLALVHLANGELELASAAIENALAHPRPIPSKELPPHSELRCAPLYEAQVEIAIAAGDLGRARDAAAKLARVAATYGSKPLAASAAFAAGRVHLAGNHTAAACGELEHAALEWSEIGAPFEAALARAHCGRAYHALGDHERAAIELETARATFERLGAVRDLADLTATLDSTTHRRHGANVFRREGELWVLIFDGHATRLRDLKGLHYLARLLSLPGRELHVLDLVSVERSPDSGDAGELLDASAKQAYRRRLVEIDDDIEQAERLGDAERVEQARAERRCLARELARAVGLGGRDRRASSTVERARASVTRAIRQAMTRIRHYHPALAAHLERTIRTGNACAYLPDPRLPPAWQL